MHANESYRADHSDPPAWGHSDGDVCPWIKRCLRRFLGMRPEHLQDYLNWCVCLFRVRRNNKRRSKMERAVHHSVMTVVTYCRLRGWSRYPFSLLVDIPL